MAKLKFKDENNEFIPVVQDVKINNTTVFDGKEADIKLKTINNQSIVGTGNININAEGEYVKYTPNQNLSNQQKLNARNNISALGTNQIKQQTGDSTTDVISQKGITDELANKQNNKPNGTNLLISTDTGKIDLVYIPSTVLGGITNGGTFNGSGIITASSYAPELQGEKIDEVQFASYPSYYFICSSPYSFAGYDFAVGDWAISLGNGWAKLNATDAVTSVNGKMGQVVLDYTDVGATKSNWGVDNKNKNLVTDNNGNVTTSDYALGQIIVDYYSELPNVNPELPHQNIPERARATVLKAEDIKHSYTAEELQESYDESIPLSRELRVYWAPERPTVTNQYIALYDENNNLTVYYDDQISEDPVYWIDTIDPVTEDMAYYVFSWSEQYLKWNDTLTNIKLYYDTWTKVTFSNVTGEPDASEQVSWSEIITLYPDVYVGDINIDENDVFVDSLCWFDSKLSGEYTYLPVTPETNPPTYYWGYTPSNVQSDNDEDNPLSLAYINNRPYIDTTSTTSLLTHAKELIKGTIQLHKISKTGKYNDLIDKVGTSEGANAGEIFNSYTGNFKNIASGNYSHAEGYNNNVTADYAHGEGQNHNIQSLATSSHAEGYQHNVSGAYSHAEGYRNSSAGSASHAEGETTVASASNSHSEGQSTTASSMCAHAEGYNTTASGQSSHAENSNTHAVGLNSHAEGYNTYARNNCSHSEGYGTQAQADYSHSEGYQTYANGASAHSEGEGTTASGQYTHAEGKNTSALSYGAHSEGEDNTAAGSWSHAEGRGTTAQSSYQHVQGKYNVVDSSSTYAHIVGNGTSSNAKSNAHTLDWSGNAWFAGNIRVGGTSWDTGTPVGGGSTPLKKTLTNASQNYSVLNGVVTVTDNDVSTNTMIMLYPSDTTTETWLESNLSSCIITEASGSFSFSISANLPATFSMYYIIMEVQ